MCRKIESHILHGLKYFSQTHLYCQLIYSQCLTVNFETDLHFCVCNQCSVPHEDHVKHRNNAKLTNNLCLILPFPDLHAQAPALHLSVSDAATVGVT